MGSTSAAHIAPLACLAPSAPSAPWRQFWAVLRTHHPSAYFYTIYIRSKPIASLGCFIACLGPPMFFEGAHPGDTHPTTTIHTWTTRQWVSSWEPAHYHCCVLLADSLRRILLPFRYTLPLPNLTCLSLYPHTLHSPEALMWPSAFSSQNRSCILYDRIKPRWRYFIDIHFRKQFWKVVSNRQPSEKRP
jgi:hypothetical protein